MYPPYWDDPGYDPAMTWTQAFTQKDYDDYCRELYAKLDQHRPQPSTYKPRSVIRCRGNPWTAKRTTLLAVVLLIAALLSL